MSIEPGVSLVIAFAIGAVPFGWIIAKLWGVNDIRSRGSSNIGATNVVRVAGWLPGALTFIFDFVKGLLPVVYLTGLSDAPEYTSWIGLLAVLGHCYSPFLKFRGGKGVSTTMGAVVGIEPILGLSSIVVYAIALGIGRVSAIGSLFAMLAILTGALFFVPAVPDKLAIALMVVVVLVRHKENWNKLLSGAAALTLAALAIGQSQLSQAALPQTQTLQDFRGKTIELPATPPRRVVALMPNLAETVVELGRGQTLVGAPDLTSLPPALQKKIKSLGPYNLISTEAVYALKPDLVLASMDGNSPDLVTKLEALGLRTVTTHSRSVDDITRSLKLIASSLGTPSAEPLKKLQEALQAAEGSKSQQRKRVFVQIGWEPVVTVGQGTFVNELVELAGGNNIFSASDTRYPRPNPEEVIARKPEVIVICQLTPNQAAGARKAREYWARFQNIPAVRNSKVLVIPGDWLVKPGFGLARGLNELQRVLR